jgi:hypothetical protein
MVDRPQIVEAPQALREISEAAGLVLQGFDERDQRILAQRLLTYGGRSTLEELGREFELTRERVRQIELNIRKMIEKRLGYPHLQCLVRAANSLAAQLGLAVPEEKIVETCSLFECSAATSKNPMIFPLLLWIGGPYEQVENWVIRKPAIENLELLKSILPQTATTAPLEYLSVKLKQFDVHEAYHQGLLVYLGGRLIGDTVIGWRGSLADKAFSLLSVAGRPMSREQLSSGIPEEHSIRTLGNYLYYDKRFCRVNLSEFGLASWGAPTYKGIVRELSDAISLSGGEASLAFLRETLSTNFGVSDKSIVSYLNSPLFAKTSTGGFRIRRDDEEVSTQTKVELTRSCFRIGNTWAYRLQIDDELIRGSGRNVPSGFAQAAGVTPGSGKSFQTELGDYRMNWFGAQPIVSSVRKFVEKLSLGRDDWIYLIPSGDSMAVQSLKMEDLEQINGLSRLCAEISPWQAPDIASPLAVVANAIGLNPDDATWTAAKRRFLERREMALFSLVPDESSEEHDLASLSDLFEYVS